MKAKCSWCGKDIEDKDKVFEYTHDDGVKESVHEGVCTTEYENSRGMN